MWTHVFQTPTLYWEATRPSSAQSRRACVARATRVPTTTTAGTDGGTPGGSNTGEPWDHGHLGPDRHPPSDTELCVLLFL